MQPYYEREHKVIHHLWETMSCVIVNLPITLQAESLMKLTLGYNIVETIISCDGAIM